MKKYIFTLLLLCLSQFSFTQNLINSWSAELEIPPVSIDGVVATFTEDRFIAYDSDCDTIIVVSSITYLPNDTISFLNDIDQINTQCELLPPGCTAALGEGRYLFSIQDDTLRFQLIDDMCDGRKVFFDRDFVLTEQCSCILDGVKNNKLDANLKVFPNPTTEDIILELESSKYIEYLTIRIYDSQNREVFTNINGVHGNQFKKKINLENINSGIYFLEISSGNKYISKKFIKNPGN